MAGISQLAVKDMSSASFSTAVTPDVSQREQGLSGCETWQRSKCEGSTLIQKMKQLRAESLRAGRSETMEIVVCLPGPVPAFLPDAGTRPGHSTGLARCTEKAGSRPGADGILDSKAVDDPGEVLFRKAGHIFDSTKATEYRFDDRTPEHLVTERRDGGYEVRTDCSGFMSSLLSSTFPRQYEAVRSTMPGKTYPRARAYADFLKGLSSSAPRDGWLGVANVKDLKAGDVIAWKNESEVNPGKVTGHVMMAAGPPSKVKKTMVNGREIRYVSVLVMDSSSIYHFPPDMTPPQAGQKHRDGLGKGFVRIVVDESDRPTGYWEGHYSGKYSVNISEPSYSDTIAFGRLVPESAR